MAWTQTQGIAPVRKCAKGRDKLAAGAGMPGAGLTVLAAGQARPDTLALKPYWGEPSPYPTPQRQETGPVAMTTGPVHATPAALTSWLGVRPHVPDDALRSGRAIRIHGVDDKDMRSGRQYGADERAPSREAKTAG